MPTEVQDLWSRARSRLLLLLPLASSDWDKGLFVAYFMGQPYVGFPPESDPARADALLRKAGTRILLVWPEEDGPDQAGKIDTKAVARKVGGRGGWEQSIEGRVRFVAGRAQSETVEVYIRSGGATSQPVSLP